ncbi:hypothetical protein C8T65DRAFT_769769 [Cerioporus squamosus]|nr:hypothetical protein C8T65DRAFT_769769 [Cerioporus squamosus]
MQMQLEVCYLQRRQDVPQECHQVKAAIDGCPAASVSDMEDQVCGEDILKDCLKHRGEDLVQIKVHNLHTVSSARHTERKQRLKTRPRSRSRCPTVGHLAVDDHVEGRDIQERQTRERMKEYRKRRPQNLSEPQVADQGEPGSIWDGDPYQSIPVTSEIRRTESVCYGYVGGLKKLLGVSYAELRQSGSTGEYLCKGGNDAEQQPPLVFLVPTLFFLSLGLVFGSES